MPSQQLVRAFLLWVACVIGGSTGLHAQDRHALVVGIDAYANVPSLQKAVNDARAVKEALVTAGFEVQLVEGPDQISFLEAIATFTAGIAPGDEAVVYYAGHGVEIDGRNYLLPSDVPAAAPGQEIVLTNRSIAVETLVQALQARGARISLLILDACRDNPFPKTGTRSIGGTRGLAQAPPAEGTFILYSAGEGETALDRLSEADDNSNSVFTRALIPLISEPGLPLREVSRRVRSDVRKMALAVNHLQFPAVYDQLDGDFAFTRSVDPTTAETALAARAAELDAAPDPDGSGAAGGCDAARADWPLIAQSDSPEAVSAFVAAYGGCPVMLALAQARLAVLAPSGMAGTLSAPADATKGTVAGPAILSRREQMHVLFALHATAGTPLAAAPEFDGNGDVVFSPADRLVLADFARSTGRIVAPGQDVVLDRTLADALLAVDLVPPAGASPLGTNVKTSGSWSSSVTESTCELQGAATSISDPLVLQVPAFRAYSGLSDSGDFMAWDMANPMPFDPTQKVTATIDGQVFDLRVAEDVWVVPPLWQGGPGMNIDVTRAMRRGTTMSITGTSALTAEPLTITYSLDGFTAAYKRLATLCRRTAILVWIE